MVVKNIIAEDMPFTKSIFEQFWRSYCKKTIFVVFHVLKFLPIYNYTWRQAPSVLPMPLFLIVFGHAAFSLEMKFEKSSILVL